MVDFYEMRQAYLRAMEVSLDHREDIQIHTQECTPSELLDTQECIS